MPAAAFTCSHGQDEICLHLAGELDVATAPHLQRTLRAAQEATPHVVVDLRDVTFIGIAGVRTIAAAGDRARRTGNRLVVVTGTRAASVFALTGSCDDVEFRDTDGAVPTPRRRSAAQRCPRAIGCPIRRSRKVADMPIAPMEAMFPAAAFARSPLPTRKRARTGRAARGLPLLRSGRLPTATRPTATATRRCAGRRRLRRPDRGAHPCDGPDRTRPCA